MYIGDISYSLYLIHWSIYSYWAVSTDGTFSGKMVALIVSVIVAVISYELVEKWYLQWSTSTVAGVCMVLVLLNLALIHKDELQEKFGISDKLVISDNMTTGVSMLLKLVHVRFRIRPRSKQSLEHRLHLQPLLPNLQV